jgi:DinB superfamily
VKPNEIADLLEASSRSLEAELRALPAEVATWHPATGEWCVNECVGHMIETEKRGFAGRIRTILDTDEPQLATWDQVAVAKSRGDCRRASAELLQELLALRRDSIALVRSLSEAQLGRAGIHEAVGRLSVDDIAHEWIHHDRNHLRQALANVQAYVWPLMGNARRFSADLEGLPRS